MKTVHFLLIILVFFFISNVNSLLIKANIVAKTAYQECLTEFQTPQIIGNLADLDVNESSGVIASRLNPKQYWTHNDSGDGPFIYAFDRKGKKQGVWRVNKAKAFDWEDIAIGPGPKKNKSYLYLADIGDNFRAREEIIIYQFLEPKISASDANTPKSSARMTKKSNIIKLKYPDGKYDAEVLLIHPKTGDLYIVTKIAAPTSEKTETARVYKATPPFSLNSTTTLSFIAELPLPTPVTFFNRLTGGDISPDGQRIILCDYQRAYELCLPNGESNFDNIWKQALSLVEINLRFQGEAICYNLDGKSILTTSEGRDSPIAEIIRK
ncbi:MAG: hypothetical protein WAQ98_27735 [Blastocatellia bacterium]